MYHRAILYIGIIPDPDKVNVTPNHGIKPNGAFTPHFNIANYCSVFCNKAVFTPGRAYVFYGYD
jgi:hypothetical protein